MEKSVVRWADMQFIHILLGSSEKQIKDDGVILIGCCYINVHHAFLQALVQCENTLSELEVIRESVDDTTGAAQMMRQFVAANGLWDAGAIVSARATEIYGLNILAEGIQTSIVFTLEEGPGVIFKALAVFALRAINLSKIESRPQRKQPLRVVDDSNCGSANLHGRASGTKCIVSFTDDKERFIPFQPFFPIK
ncbi:hypothetical protein QJS10_CPB21g00964 [Acorus calamus]|uniref:Prephenate dehydratase domain-containing protein n=1 Tax=Acorus calamus TaxID=4465 RepID=A0AAV9C870_ACOCL|nr:hypothetical protein QJS10_CPB21g00964 [Acorus calamus]